LPIFHYAIQKLKAVFTAITSNGHLNILDSFTSMLGYSGSTIIFLLSHYTHLNLHQNYMFINCLFVYLLVNAHRPGDSEGPFWSQAATCLLPA